jgi:hypothetical protein
LLFAWSIVRHVGVIKEPGSEIKEPGSEIKEPGSEV